MNHTINANNGAVETATRAESKNPRVAAFQRIFEKVCEQLNFNERERAWFRDLLKDELRHD